MSSPGTTPVRLGVRNAAWHLATRTELTPGAFRYLVLVGLRVGRFSCLAVLLTAGSSAAPELEPTVELIPGPVHYYDGRAHAPETTVEIGHVPRYAIRSVAGRTDVVDGIPAVTANLFGPCAAAVGPSGSIYVSDTWHHRIRVVDSSGIISTIAGTGDWGYSGDGGAATQAQLNFPCGVAVDAAGNLFVADVENHRVRRIDGSTGLISTYAGTGDSGYAGDGRPAATAHLARPTGVAVDGAGRVFIADFGNGRVRMVDPASRMIATLRGKRPWVLSGDGRPAPPAGFGGWAVAVDSSGHLYVADPTRRLVSRFDIASGALEILASSMDRGYEGYGGPSTWARFLAPQGLAVDPEGNVYVADPLGASVHRIDGATGAITRLYPNRRGRFGRDGGWVVEQPFRSPKGVAVDDEGHLYIVDSGDHRVRKVNQATREITTLAGTGAWNVGWEGGIAAGARFARPESLAVDGAGNVFLVDSNRVWKLDRQIGSVTAFAGTGERGYSGDGDLAIDASMRAVRGLATDAQGNVYVGECGRVRKIDTSGIITTVAGTRGREGRLVILEGSVPALEARLNCVESLALDRLGNLYLLESENGVTLPYVLRIDTSGKIGLFASQVWAISGWNGRPDFEVELRDPSGIAVDSAGRVYVSDARAGRILRIDTTARSVEKVLATKGYRPEALSVGPAGNVYVGGGHRIRLINSDGSLAVLAGNGKGGYSGDGGPAAGAGLSVSGLAVDPLGTIWFTDPNSRRLRILERWPGHDGAL